jgi:hypothetical protein
MRLNPRLKPAAALILSMSLLAIQLERAAMAQGADKPSAAQPEKIPAVRILPVSAVAPAPQAAARAAAARLREPAAPQAQKPKKRGVLKWVLIGAGAGVGVAFLATRGEPTPVIPVITVGAPVVERPQ